MFRILSVYLEIKLRKIKKTIILLVLSLIIPIIIFISTALVLDSIQTNIEHTYIKLLPVDFASNSEILNDTETLETMDNVDSYENAFSYMMSKGINIDTTNYSFKTKRDYFIVAYIYIQEIDKKYTESFITKIFNLIFYIWCIVIVFEIVYLIFIIIIIKIEKSKTSRN